MGFATNANAHREVKLFLVLTFSLSALFYGAALLAPGVRDKWLTSYSGLFMWCPAVSAILTRLILYKSLRGLGWGWGKTRFYFWSYAFSLLLVVPVYVLVWFLGLAQFNHVALAEVASRYGLPRGPATNFGLPLLVIVSAPISIVSTLGEELGWRGFLVPRLASITNLRNTSLITGLIWSVWHYPLVFILLPRYRPDLPVWYATLCFTISVVGISFFYTWLRMESGSVWPPALTHATGNQFQGVLEGLTVGTTLTHFLTYEYGIGFTIPAVAIAILFWRKWR